MEFLNVIVYVLENQDEITNEITSSSVRPQKNNFFLILLCMCINGACITLFRVGYRKRVYPNYAIVTQKNKIPNFRQPVRRKQSYISFWPYCCYLVSFSYMVRYDTINEKS